MKKTYKTLRLILGDQLNASHSWLREKDDTTVYLIGELKQETEYVKHHIQKLCAFFQAMENFSSALEKSGHHVHYLTLDDTIDYKTLTDLLDAVIKKFKVGKFEYQLPDEYRVRSQLKDFAASLEIDSATYDTEHFLVGDNELAEYFHEDKNNVMETFYRKMRKRYGYLMKNDNPEGGEWNYDEKNRNRLSADDIAEIPKPSVFRNDVTEIFKRITKHEVPHFGEISCSQSEKYKIVWPTSRAQSRSLLKDFCKDFLPNFGTFQDAMTDQSKHAWSLYHSRLSFSMNTKMISPKEVIEAAIDAYRNGEKEISIAQIEGFVRQILGWREFMRGIYWTFMPDYEKKNALNARRKLPDFFWTGDTKMNCMKQAISQSLEHAYAHHIQRLMVTGNFCLLAGIKPDEVDEWYLGIYIDALQWVELTNTRGMSQFADGGIVGSKPYAASGNYINKMSDYCKNCEYAVSKKTDDNACPLNSMYWHFMNRHRGDLEKNPRIGFAYNTLDKMDNAKKDAILDKGEWCLKHLDDL